MAHSPSKVRKKPETLNPKPLATIENQAYSLQRSSGEWIALGLLAHGTHCHGGGEGEESFEACSRCSPGFCRLVMLILVPKSYQSLQGFRKLLQIPKALDEVELCAAGGVRVKTYRCEGSRFQVEICVLHASTLSIKGLRKHTTPEWASVLTLL